MKLNNPSRSDEFKINQSIFIRDLSLKRSQRENYKNLIKLAKSMNIKLGTGTHMKTDYWINNKILELQSMPI